MTKKHIGIGSGVVVLILAGLVYHFVFGYVESTRVNDDVTVLTRKNTLNQIGANVIVYENDQGVAIVDTQLPPLASSTRASVDALIEMPIANVIITHWHPDHSGGISVFSSDVDVVAHQNVLNRLSVPQEGFGLTKPGSHHRFPARVDDELPTQTVVDRLELPIGSDTITVVHHPKAHTDGDLVVFFHDSKVVAIGDLVWPNSFPYVDVHNGGSVAGLESALQALLAESKSGYQFVPGHGATLMIEDIDLYLEMVSQTRRWVEIQLEEGQSIDQIVASGLPQEWARWSSPLVPSKAWIKTIHASSNFARVPTR